MAHGAIARVQRANTHRPSAVGMAGDACSDALAGQVSLAPPGEPPPPGQVSRRGPLARAAQRVAEDCKRSAGSRQCRVRCVSA
jgi:hypothetical protein